MNLCVASDTHANTDAIRQMITREMPDTVLFLGDGVDEMIRETKRYGVGCALVAGNCDLFCAEPYTREVEFEGIRIFMTHGHRFGVKQGLADLASAVLQSGCAYGLFGHTHQYYEGKLHGITLYNPGSLGMKKSYLVAELANGKAVWRKVEL